MKKNFFEINVNELTSVCDEKKFSFNTTDELQISDEFIAQDRAINALKFGISVNYKGYNIYVSGHDGTGKTSTVRAILEDAAKTKSAPNDWVYVNNFENPENPTALELPPGMGRVLKKDMDMFVKVLLKEIPQAFESKDYEDRLNEMMQEYNEIKNTHFKELEKNASKLDFEIKVTKVNVVTVPIIEGKPIGDKEYEKLMQEQKDDLEKKREKVNREIVTFLRKIRETDKLLQKKIEELQKDVGLLVVGQNIDDIVIKYKDLHNVLKYLDDVKQNILENLIIFTNYESNKDPKRVGGKKTKDFVEFQVNVVVDNTNAKGAPIIFEKNPTYFNLFGKLEKRIEYGFYLADFTMIMAGSILKANGGYLVINVLDVLTAFRVWDHLKRVTKNREITIDDPLEEHGIIATTGFKPQPIPLDVKVIMIGNPMIYYLLHHYDEDFKNIFKVKADFDYEMPRTNELINKCARFVATRCRENKLKHFTKDGVAALIEYSSRYVEDKEKLTTQFGKINDLIVEANYWANQRNKKYVTREDVDTSIEEKIKRSNLFQEKTNEYILKDILMIDTKAEVVGQVNGLSVLDYGDLQYGRPVRITAKTYKGSGNVINIERESKLSGRIHDKGVLILNGYMGSKYAQEAKLNLSASLCFEQSYDQIDGDSASAAELFSVLSSIANIPIKQYIACTGSINQKGEIQPIGGVNFKIEGFFDICKTRSLTGKEGVMIPHQNVQNLMLKKEVLNAVREKKFHIYPIKTIDEGIEILTGIPAGKLVKGKYEKNTIHYMVSKVLEKMARPEKSKKRRR
jgi:lon-related putative ATP-dependent protease